MDEFVGWSLWHAKKDSKCSKCGMKEKKGGCCKEEHKQIKIEADHQKSSISHCFHIIGSPVIATSFITITFNAVWLPNYIPPSNAPPHIPKERLYIFNCVFVV